MLVSEFIEPVLLNVILEFCYWIFLSSGCKNFLLDNTRITNNKHDRDPRLGIETTEIVFFKLIVMLNSLDITIPHNVSNPYTNHKFKISLYLILNTLK